MHILMPTEIINRDLDFQVLLAARAVRPGRRIILGRRDALHRILPEVAGGVFIGKAFEPFFPHVDTSFYQLLKAQGFVGLHLDDEGAVFAGDEAELARQLQTRFDPSHITGDDYVCTWGDWQRDFYRSMKAPDPERVKTTGHPRFDFLRSPRLREYYAPRAAELKGRYGDFLLLNTNLQIANNGLGIKYSFTKRFGYDAKDATRKREAVAFWAHTTKILINYVKLVHRLADEFPKLRVVVRPHPSEDQQFYRTVFSDVPNVSVIHEGSVIPWLFASRALLHDGCTTGIEAALAGLPIINYKSLEEPKYDSYLPNLFGTRCTSEDEAVTAVHAILRGERPAPDTKNLPLGDRDRSLLANFDAETLERLLGVIDAAEDATRRASLRSLRMRAREGVADAVARAKDAARRVIPRSRTERAYSRTKFYGFRQAQLEQRMADAERVTGTRLKLEIHSDTLISFTAA